jgi:hypothetical protein
MGRHVLQIAALFFWRNNMQVKYIGNHIKQDSIEGCKLVWEPGQVRDVTSTLASHLLQYTDTWVSADGDAKPEGPDPQWLQKTEAGVKEEPIGFLEKDKRPDEPVPVVNFHSMSRDEMLKFADDHLTVKMDKRWTKEKLREQITHAWAEQHMDQKTR